MSWFIVIAIGGYILYVMRPDERRRLLVLVDRLLGTARDAVMHHGRQPDAFRDALHARTAYPFASAAVLLLNLSVFVVIVVSPGGASDPDTLLRWGASVGPSTTNGEWWRLLTAAFVHGGVVHLAIDMAALAQAAVLTERLCGHMTFTAVYLSAAVLAGGIGLAADPLTISSGAGGAIFGIHGLLVAVVVRGTLQRSPIRVPLRILRRLAPPAGAFVIYSMWSGGTQWTAGLATFVTGFALGLALARNVTEQTPSPRLVLPLTAATMAMTALLVTPLHGTIDLRSHIVRLVQIDDQTSEAYRAATDQFKRGGIKAHALAQVIERGVLPRLQAGRTELAALAGVPPQQQPLLALANEYLRLRCESWGLRATALNRLNSRLLREADEKERTSLEALEALRRAVASPTRDSS